MSLKQAPAATLDLLVQRPELAVVFWMDPNYTPPKQPAWVRWIARLLGGYTPPMELPEPPPELARNGAEIDLDKAWHALQWLLTKPLSKSEGDEWELPPPEGTLLSAGAPVEGSDHGYGDERAIYPEETSSFAEFLLQTPWSEVASRYDAAAMDSAGVYPTGWGEPDRLEWLEDIYGRLRAFVQETRNESLGMVVQLS